MVANVCLAPSLFSSEESINFIEGGYNISTAVSPRDNSLAVFATLSEPEKARPTESNYASHIFISSWDGPLSDSRRKLISDSFVTMTKFNQSQAQHHTGIMDEEFSEEDLIWFHGIVDEYMLAIKLDTDRLEDQDPLPEGAIAHNDIMYAIMGLFQTMHVPSNGSLSGLVGEVLLEWLNANFVAPDSQEAVELQNLSHPWDDDRFWNYLIRCLLRGLTRVTYVLFEKLQKHPSRLLWQSVETMTNFLKSHPRSTSYSTEHDFFVAWRHWKNSVIAFRKQMEQTSVDEAGGNWLSWMLEIVRIMEGDKDTVKRQCQYNTEGWKEALCVWGVWVDIGLRRQHIERLLINILEDIPLDPTLPEESVFAALFSGQIGEAVKLANKLDIWLAAHLVDIMQPLGLLIDLEGADLSIREHFLLGYAEHLLVDPSLWRIAVLYMCECGEQGKLRADQVLLHIPPELGQLKRKDKSVIQNGDTDRSNLDKKVQEILEICREHGREHVRREICQIAARSFVDWGHYHLAISYYTSAEDWLGVGRVVDLMLAKSLSTDFKKFVASVLEIAPTLQHPSSYSQLNVQRRLAFLVKYAEFHTRWSAGDIQDAAMDIVIMFREELVPKSWWGILLKQAGELLLHDAEVMPFDVSEVFDLLRRLDEVQTHVDQGSGLKYLQALVLQIGKGGEQEALRQLDSVRLALARYFARCSVLAVGGRGKIFASS